MPLSPDHKYLFDNLAHQIGSRLSQGADSVPLLDLVYKTAWNLIENDEEAVEIADDLVNDVIPARSRRLVSFGYADYDSPGTSLDLLDLDTSQVFVLVDRSQIDDGIRVIAELPKGDTEALRTYVSDEMAFGASTGGTLSAWPEAIEVFDPVTNEDVLQTFTRLLVPNRDECQQYVPLLKGVTGRNWRTRSVADRMRIARTYVAIALGDDSDNSSDDSRVPDRLATFFDPDLNVYRREIVKTWIKRFPRRAQRPIVGTVYMVLDFVDAARSSWADRHRKFTTTSIPASANRRKQQVMRRAAVLKAASAQEREVYETMLDRGHDEALALDALGGMVMVRRTGSSSRPKREQ